MALFLTLGPVTFDSLELPEQLDQLGGSQLTAFHDFPGGGRSAQTFGAFPDAMEWKGILTGTTALDRAQEIDRIRVAAQPVVLSYERFAYLGIVTQFLPRPKHQWMVPYDLKFYPIQDLSGANTVPLDTNTLEIQLLTQVALLTSLYAGTSITAAAGISVLLALPLSLVAPVGGLLSTVGLALAAAGGVVANITADAEVQINTACAAVIAAALALIEGNDPSTSSPALDASNYAGAIQNIVGAAEAPRWQVQAINPDLSLLAAQYLGDASQWRAIANLNGLYDPQPIGQFTLNIPPPGNI